MTAEPPSPHFTTLTHTERHDLLWLARRSIVAALSREEPPPCPTLTDALRAPAAAFVSLHHRRQLRGCVGTLSAEQPLYATVVRMAVSAAFDDPRFPPLAASELQATEIEISRLSQPVAAIPAQIRPGHHGVCVSAGDRRAVFLPQVATQYRWDRETLLRELCLKARLPANAWRRPDTELMLFEAEVFGEGAE